MTEDRHYRMPLVLKDEDDLNPSNLSAGASFQEIADIRFSRRTALKGLLATSAGDPKDAAQGAKYGGAVSDSGWFANPDNIAFDPKGRLWVATDGFPDFGVHDGVWATDTEGAGGSVRLLRQRPALFCLRNDSARC
jgi:uncharacterized protein DUF839